MPEISIIAFGVVLLLAALVGNIRPFIAAAGALGALALCMAWLSSFGSVHMGMAIFIVAVLIGAPIVAFVVTYGALKASGKVAIALPGAARGFLLLAGILVIVGTGYVKDIEENVDARIEVAIRDNDPAAIAKEKKRNGARANQERIEKIMGLYGITEDSLALLRSFQAVNSYVWYGALKYPASPERLHFLREIAKMDVQYLESATFIQLMDEGEVESADVIYPFIRFPDSAMVSAERPDLLRNVIRRGIPDEHYPYKEFPALVLAAEKDLEYTRILLDAGYDPNAANLRYHGPSPLARAVLTTPKNHAVVEALLTAGAHVDHVDISGQTALHMAAMEGDAEALKLLLDKGANVSTQDKAGMTPLHHAALYGDEASCSLLLAAGASVDAADKEGQTPLAFAVNLGGGLVVAALLENASPATKELAGAANEKGVTPWDLAVKYSHLWGGQYKRLVNVKFCLGDKGFRTKNGDVERDVPGAEVWLTSLNARAAAVRLLLAAGADPAHRLKEGNTLFHSAFDYRLSKRLITPERGLKGYWQYVHERVLEDAYWETLPAFYSQTLEALLREGIPLPDLKEGETYEKYCQSAPRRDKKYMYVECKAVLEAERARREADR